MYYIMYSDYKKKPGKSKKKKSQKKRKSGKLQKKPRKIEKKSQKKKSEKRKSESKKKMGSKKKKVLKFKEDDSYEIRNNLINKIKLDIKKNRDLEENVNYEVNSFIKKGGNIDIDIDGNDNNVYSDNNEEDINVLNINLNNNVENMGGSSENISIFCKNCNKEIKEENIILNVKDKLSCKICENILESNTILLSEFL